jgi:ATP-dependent Clp protease ATP-binding subunit ClpA
MRAPYQPIRYLAQGTPATGKSESAELIAECLEVPCLNIDASVFSDKYSASSQLFGAARGIVGSFESGELEQAAKHHIGAVVEISDLDHCEPGVRMQLADLFLRILDRGEAQATKGPIFSCANLIFAFTINLPFGMDEEVHRSFGFNEYPDDEEVGQKVIGHLREMFSGAFLSRVGYPILFDPLAGSALGSIVENALRVGLERATQRLDLNVDSVFLEKNVGEKLLPHLKSNIDSFGALSLIEKAQSEAADALLNLIDSDVEFDNSKLVVGADRKARLRLKIA